MLTAVPTIDQQTQPGKLTTLVKLGLRVTSEFHRLRMTGPMLSIQERERLRPAGVAIREMMAEIEEREL